MRINQTSAWIFSICTSSAVFGGWYLFSARIAKSRTSERTHAVADADHKKVDDHSPAGEHHEPGHGDDSHGAAATDHKDGHGEGGHAPSSDKGGHPPAADEHGGGHGNKQGDGHAKKVDKGGHGDEGAHGSESPWGYTGKNGPKTWATLDTSYVTCGSGKVQSPVEIKGSKRSPNLTKIEFNYRPSPVALQHNGHTIRADYEFGSFIRAENEYELVDFHFHRPSEHVVNGNTFDMEMHLVHKSREGSLAVVGILLEEGNNNPAIDLLWSHLPSGPGTRGEPFEFDALTALPKTRGYYTYSGSLTTPPCSEGIKWIVMKQPIRISAKQMERFTKLVGFNSRPPQPLNGRAIRATP